MKKIYILLIIMAVICCSCSKNNVLNSEEKNILIDSISEGIQERDSISKFDEALKSRNIEFNKILVKEKLNSDIYESYNYYLKNNKVLKVYKFKKMDELYNKIISEGVIEGELDYKIETGIVYANDLVIEENFYIDEFDTILEILDEMK